MLHHITHLSSNNTNPFKIDEDIDIKAHYKATPNDNGYKEVKFAYAIAKTDKFNELVKKEPTGVVNLKDKVATINSEQESKDIIFNPSKDIKDEKELQKLKEGNHSLVIFAYLQDKQASSTKSNDPEYTPAFKTNYGKTHIRFDFKIPMYLEFTGSKLIIYEFEDMDEDNIFGAGVNARLSDKECYINSGLNKGNDDTRRFKYYPLRIKAYVLSTISKRHW